MNTQTQEALRLIKVHDESGNIEDLVAAYNACKEALAQPAQDCQYGKDVGMPEYSCIGKCQYAQEEAQQAPYKIQFPTMLRQMWSGGMVQDWINKLPKLYTHPAPHPAEELVLNVEKIINEFPLLDDEGLDEDKHHCEWAIQQDRKRLHAIIKNTHPAPHPAQEPVARIEVFNLLTKNGAFAIKEEWLWNIRYINSKGIIRKFPNEYPSEKKYAIQSAKYWADFLNCKIVEVDNRGNK